MLNELVSEDLVVGTSKADAPEHTPLLRRLADHPLWDGVPSLLRIAAILGLILMVLAPLFFVPAEDALILHQYSDNWAYTGQITYNRGGPRVEGATDFLWMAFLAFMRVLHVSPFYATAAVNLISVVAIAVLLLSLTGERRRIGKVLLVSGAVMLMPQISAGLAGFSVLPFSLLIVLAAFFFQKGRDAALAITLLILCLFRPDGVVFAMPLIALRLFASENKKIPQFAKYLLLFVLPGCVYFVWRWKYFGEFLPLPFLVKSDTHRILGIAIGDSNLDILKYLFFDTILLAVVFGRQVFARRNLLLLTALGIVPTLFYLTMRLDQDVADRFFMYLLVCPAILISLNWRSLRITPRQLTATCAVLWILLLAFAWTKWMVRFFSDGHDNNIVAIAHELADVRPKGLLALSEAGRIAYYSQWPTMDLWGLNTPVYAHHLTSPSDIVTKAPDLLVLYFPESHDDCRYNSSWQVPHAQRNWPNLAQNVITGIHDAQNYDLWMVPSSGVLKRRLYHFRPGAGEYQCWYIKRSFAGHDAIVSILESHGALAGPHFWHIRFGVPETNPSVARLAAGELTSH